MNIAEIKRVLILSFILIFIGGCTPINYMIVKTMENDNNEYLPSADNERDVKTYEYAKKLERKRQLKQVKRLKKNKKK